jgi:transposase
VAGGVGFEAMFGAALGLTTPWQVASVEFGPGVGAGPGRLDIGLDFPRGSRFACPQPGCQELACPVHDTVDRTWRHLDFFQHWAFLHARVPRVRCPEHGVHVVEVSWARPGSGFTLLFEAALLTYAQYMAVAPLAAMAGEHDTRVWRVLGHHVSAARAGMDFSGVTEIGVDETSARRGQDYVTVFMDLAERRTVFATEGRNADTVAAFAADLAAHGGTPGTQIVKVTCDMSPAFIKGINTHLGTAPDAATGAGGHVPQIVFDRFHVLSQGKDAVDAVRRAESKTRPELRGSRYLWLRNEANLKAEQLATKAWLTRPSLALKTARASRWIDDFSGFYDQPSPAAAEAYLIRWCYGAKRSRLEPIRKFVTTVEKHWDGILAWATHRITNGLLEGTNSLIQAAKARARGYRSKKNMITVIYLISGQLPLPQIHTI